MDGPWAGSSVAAESIIIVELPKIVRVGGEATDPSLNAPQDEALVQGLRALDPHAYEILLNRYEGPVYRFFYYSHGDHDLAQDQCCETFGNMILAIQKMRGDASSLRAFVFGVARNVMRRGWRRRRFSGGSDDALAYVPDPRPTAHRRAADRQEFQQALAAINDFDEPARQVMLLRFVEEFSLEEIATALEMPLGSVKSHIHRCRKRLKNMLGR